MTQPPPGSAPEDGPDSGPRLVARSALRFVALVAVVLALATVALGSQQVLPLLPGTDPVDDDSFVRLERHGCYGTCPQFVVTVCGDGEVEYVGRQFVNETGRVEYSVPESEAHRLFALVAEVGFLEYRERYENEFADDPTATLRVRVDGETNVVDFDRNVGPDGLYRLADAVEAVAHPYADHRDDTGPFEGSVTNATAVC